MSRCVSCACRSSASLPYPLVVWTQVRLLAAALGDLGFAARLKLTHKNKRDPGRNMEIPYGLLSFVQASSQNSLAVYQFGVALFEQAREDFGLV